MSPFVTRLPELRAPDVEKLGTERLEPEIAPVEEKPYSVPPMERAAGKIAKYSSVPCFQERPHYKTATYEWKRWRSTPILE